MTNINRIKVKINLYLSHVYMYLNSFDQAKIQITLLINCISREEIVENKFDLLRELVKNSFHFGFIKLSNKKTTLEEIDRLRKEINIVTLTFVQSRFQSIVNSLFRCNL